MTPAITLCVCGHAADRLVCTYDGRCEVYLPRRIQQLPRRPAWWWAAVGFIGAVVAVLWRWV